MAKKIALLIGVSEYGEGIPPLSAPPNDVAAMQQVLEDKKLGGFDEVIPLINPDLVTMQQSIQQIFFERDRDDLVLLFFSGHGITDDNNKLYLTTKGTSKKYFKATSVQSSLIQDISKESYAKRQVIILDCCYSGAFADGWSTKSVGLDIKKELGAEGRVVLTSSSATQTSFQQEDSALSLYTQYLIEGIKTGAADSDGNGKIYAHELHNYAKAKVKEVKPKIAPEIILDKEGFNIIISQAPINDPELEFRKLVEKYVRNGKISSYGRDIIKTKQNDFTIDNQRVEEIINSILEPFQRRLANIQKYREAYQEEVNKQYPHPLDRKFEEELMEWGQEVITNKEAESIRQQEVQEKLQQEQEKYENQYNQLEPSKIVQEEVPPHKNTSNESNIFSKTINIFNQLTNVVSQQIDNSVGFVHEYQKKTYQEKLDYYERLFFRAIKIEFPVNGVTQH
jgi:hypothetical protein